MPEKYQGESEDSTTSKNERLKIKMKKLKPFAVLLPGVPPVKGGPKLNELFQRMKLRMDKEDLERKRNEEYRKRAKRPSS